MVSCMQCSPATLRSPAYPNFSVCSFQTISYGVWCVRKSFVMLICLIYRLMTASHLARRNSGGPHCVLLVSSSPLSVFLVFHPRPPLSSWRCLVFCKMAAVFIWACRRSLWKRFHHWSPSFCWLIITEAAWEHCAVHRAYPLETWVLPFWYPQQRQMGKDIRVKWQMSEVWCEWMCRVC